VVYVVTKLKYGNTNTFFIRGTVGNLLIDADYAGTLPAFYRAIKEHDIKIRDIDYVLATHYHPDHIGLISDLIKQDVKLLILDTQYSYIHFSDGIFSRDKHLNYEPITTKKATVIGSEESRNFLKNIGINGEIVATTSHSNDSISLILDGGECFVGDLEPIEHLGGYEQNKELKNDWELIMRFTPKVIYYAHANEKIL
jgi:glyoxylase-like metal-dependent hydrolase (beta-lactamase superfamily II)